MKIIIIGPGAMGCLFGALLAEGGRDVILVDRHLERAAAIARRGVKVEGIGGARTVPVRAGTNLAEFGSADLVCIFVKSYDTQSAMRHVLPCVTPGTLVLTLQNGLGNIEQIASMVDRKQILAGTTGQAATSLGPGHVRHAGRGMTVVGYADKQNRPHAERVAELLNGAGIETEVTADLDSAIWQKLIVNAAINPLTALFGVRNGELLGNPKWRQTLRDAAEEAASVARAKGIHLDYGNIVTTVEDVCRATKDNISSMLQDVRRNRKTEIEAITGVVAKEAKALGLSVPVNESLLARVRSLESGAERGSN